MGFQLAIIKSQERPITILEEQMMAMEDSNKAGCRGEKELPCSRLANVPVNQFRALHSEAAAKEVG